MRALQLVGENETELRDVPEPEPGPGELVLKVAGAGVCHSDLHFLHIGHELFPLPLTLGHEIAGTIAAVGPGVSGWEEGEPAVVYLSWGCGRCRACLAGAEQYCEAFPRGTVPGAGIGYPGGMAEFVLLPARHAVELGDLDPVAAAPLTDAALTPYHAIELSRDLLAPSATAVVIGVGGLGHMAVQILRATTAVTVVAVDTDEGRLHHATELGADHAIISDERANAEVLRLTRERGADVVLDFVGVQATLALAASTVRSGGRVTIVGVAGGELAYNTAGPPVGLPWGASVVRPFGGTRSDLHEVLSLARKGAISVTTQSFALDQGDEVFGLLEAGKITGRAVLIP